MKPSNAQTVLPCEPAEATRIGNSLFEDDIWDLSPLIPQKTLPESRKKLNFTRIKAPLIRHTVKLFIHYKLGRVKPTTTTCIFNSLLPYFIRYCEENRIHSFSKITPDMLIDHTKWLKDTIGISKRTGYMASFYVEELISVGQVYGWDIPAKAIPEAARARTLWGTGRDTGAKKFDPIPDDVLEKIIRSAVDKEKNILTKAGIIIQSQTGLRIGEVLSLTSGCLHHQREGPPYIDVMIFKTAKGKGTAHKVLVNDLVVKAIEELERETAHLRRESRFKELFLHRNNGIRVAGSMNWSKNRLRTFVRTHDIRGSDGALYPLKSHQFRATFVKQLVLRNVPIAYVMKQFSHVSIEMTAHYLDLKENEVRDIYAQLLLSPDSHVAGYGAKKIQNLKEQQFKGKTAQEVEAVISSLAKTITFNPLPGGICLYDYRRGNCSNGDGCFFYDCPNFVTETSFLPVLQNELELMEREMERTSQLGYARQLQIQQVRHRHLKPLVMELGGEVNE